MANKRADSTKDVEVKKKKTNTTNTKKSSTTKKGTTVSKTTKSNIKKTAPAKASTKTGTKKTTAPKKTTVKKKPVENDIEIKSVELVNVLEKENAKLDNSNKDKFINDIDIKINTIVEKTTTNKKKDKKLLMVGIFIVILGIISLFVSIIANRIVDREFLSDNAITLMMVASIIIEGFGAFIIINES